MSKIINRDDRIKEFLAEAEDILNSMGKDLLKLGKGVKAGVIDPAVLNSIFRAAHTIKGMSGIYDFKAMAALGHSLEDTLDLLRLGRVSLNSSILDSIMRAHELLLRITASKRDDDFISEIEKIRRNLSSSCQMKVEKKEQIDNEFLSVLTEYEEHRFRENLREGSNIFIVNVKFPITSFDKGYLALTEVLKTEAEIIATLPSSKTSQEMLFFDILVGTKRDRDFTHNLVKDTAEVEIRVLSSGKTAESKPEPVFEVLNGKGLPEAPKETLRRSTNTVRVNIRKLDSLMNVLSELSIIKSSISGIAARLRNERDLSSYGIELLRSERSLDRKLSELRDGILDVRMVPIGYLFSRFETFLNKLSRESGKEIRMSVYGDETELDKLIIEELADPLMHIMRNIVDHAIEEPSVRESLGKPRAGTITLSAGQEGNHVKIEVADDGTGIDAEFVKEKALAKGIITADDLKNLSRQEVLDLIFTPGFSTRDTVSETSGRGIGMDVVKENITRLSGIIDIETSKGKGMKLTLTIPVTLAIIKALIVEDSGYRYAVPLNSVLEIIELRNSGGNSIDAGEPLTGDNRNMQFVRLSRFFGKDPGHKNDVYYGIIARLAEHRLCIIVEHLVEELDVVIKPLSRIIRVPGIAGATDMGEKGIVLVLDITGMLDQVLKEKKAGLKVLTMA